MRFEIRRVCGRVDDQGNEIAPCDNAESSEEVISDTRGCTEEQYNRFIAPSDYGLKWRDKGFDHRITEFGEINRKLKTGSKIWFIEIENLTALMQLVEKEGKLIIDKNQIIIYDDYIE